MNYTIVFILGVIIGAALIAIIAVIAIAIINSRIKAYRQGVKDSHPYHN